MVPLPNAQQILHGRYGQLKIQVKIKWKKYLLLLF